MVEDIVTALAKNGYATIPGAISAEQVAWARTELEAIVEQTPVGRGDFEGYRTRRVYGLFGKTRSLDALAIHDVVLGVLDRVLGQYQLSAPTGISIGPGESPQPLHPDDAIYPLPRPHAEVVVNVMWPLQDFTATNGATRIVPGSHRWTDERPGPDTPTTPRSRSRPGRHSSTRAVSGTGEGQTTARPTDSASCCTTRWAGCGPSRTTSSWSRLPSPPPCPNDCRSFSATTSIRRSSATSTDGTPAS